MTLYRPAETHGSVSVPHDTAARMIRAAATVPHDTAARMIRAAAMKRSGLQVEDEENDPDRLADEAVVAIVRVPLTAALIPCAEPVRLKDADPEPPATASSSASVSSITSSFIPLLVYRCLSSS
jgi:hypothetical protein